MGQCMCSGMSQSTRLAECLSKDDADAALETVRHQPALLLQVVDTEGGNGPFHMAVLLRAHRSLARLLALSSSFSDELALVQKAKHAINQGRLGDGATPLMLACGLGDVEACSLLLQAGANPGARDQPYRKTCLHYAAAQGHVNSLRLVLEHAMTPRSRLGGSFGTIPSKISSQHAKLRRTSSARSLVDLPSVSGLTPLMVAAANNHQAAVQELLRAGADPRLSTWDNAGNDFCNACAGCNALHIAAANNSLKAALVLLLDQAARPSPRPPLPSSPRAGVTSSSGGSGGGAATGDLRAVMDRLGRTPAQVAQAAKHEALAGLLGASVPMHVCLQMLQQLATSAKGPSPLPGSPRSDASQRDGTAAGGLPGPDLHTGIPEDGTPSEQLVSVFAAARFSMGVSLGYSLGSGPSVGFGSGLSVGPGLGAYNNSLNSVHSLAHSSRSSPHLSSQLPRRSVRSSSPAYSRMTTVVEGWEPVQEAEGDGQGASGPPLQLQVQHSASWDMRRVDATADGASGAAALSPRRSVSVTARRRSALARSLNPP